MHYSPARDLLFLGLDGGGTKCRARLVNAAGAVLGEGAGGPANPVHGTERALASMLAASEAALASAGLSVSVLSQVVAGIGLAGVNLPKFYRAITAWPHPFARMFLTTDLHIACLGAHGGEEGAVIVAGTGSCGYAQVGQHGYLVGGHGFPYGDQASGGWLGFEAVRAALLAQDGLGPATVLAKQLAEQFSAQAESLAEAMAGASQSDYATLAPLVLEAAAQGDQVARALIDAGTSYLAAMAEKLCQTGARRLSLLGGVGSAMQPYLPASLTDRLSPALAPPEAGAVWYARAQLAAEK